MQYKIEFVAQLLTISSEVNKNNPKLINEKAAVHNAKRFRYSF